MIARRFRKQKSCEGRRHGLARHAFVSGVPPPAWRDGVVQLHKNDESYAPVGAEHAQQSAECVEALAITMRRLIAVAT
jgi:hypothetical protein